MERWRQDLAWAAGLLEGEGSITVCGGTPRLGLKLSDEEVLRRFAGILGVGKIYGPDGPYGYDPPKQLAKKPAWMWVCERKAAAAAIEAMAPMLSMRRVERALEIGLLR
jgi:hypothetical protein